VKEIGFLSRTFTESSNVWFSHLKVTAEKSKKHCRMIWAFNLGNMVLKTNFPFSTYHIKMNQWIKGFPLNDCFFLLKIKRDTTNLFFLTLGEFQVVW
jgi:hypothetical protein